MRCRVDTVFYDLCVQYIFYVWDMVLDSCLVRVVYIFVVNICASVCVCVCVCHGLTPRV